MWLQTDSGTINVTISIDGVDVTGLTNIPVTNTESTIAATALFSVVAGGKVDITTTSNATAVNLSVKLNYTKIF